MIRSYLEKRRDQKDIRDAILRARDIDIVGHPFTAARIEFVFVFVAGNTPQEISDRVGRVTEIAMSHDATVHDILGALVVIAFGAHSVISPPAVGKRSALVEHLSRELSRFAKIVHGAADGHFGLFGSGERKTYSFVLPRFDVILGRLGQTEFGTVEEFEK